MDCSHSDWREMVPHCGFDLHFSDNEWCWASLHVFVSHLYVFFGEMSLSNLLHSAWQIVVPSTNFVPFCVHASHRLYPGHGSNLNIHWQMNGKSFEMRFHCCKTEVIKQNCYFSGNVNQYWASEFAQLCMTLCNPMGCSLRGSSIHGIFQARVLKWVAISFSRDLLDLGIESRSLAFQADTLLSEPPGKHCWGLCQPFYRDCPIFEGQ